MLLKRILFAGSALAALMVFATPAGAAPYDPQAAETRRLNELQLEHPGAGVRAVPGYRGDSDDEDGDRYGDDDDDRYGDRDDDDDAYDGRESHDYHARHGGGGMDSGGYRPDGYDDYDDADDGGGYSGGYRPDYDDDRAYGGRARADDYGDQRDDDRYGDDNDDDDGDD